jgi:hypothetical protein
LSSKTRVRFALESAKPALRGAGEGLLKNALTGEGGYFLFINKPTSQFVLDGSIMKQRQLLHRGEEK